MSLLLYPNTSRTLLTPRLIFNPRQEEVRSKKNNALIIFIVILFSLQTAMQELFRFRLFVSDLDIIGEGVGYNCPTKRMFYCFLF